MSKNLTAINTFLETVFFFFKSADRDCIKGDSREKNYEDKKQKEKANICFSFEKHYITTTLWSR